MKMSECSLYVEVKEDRIGLRDCFPYNWISRPGNGNRHSTG